MELCDALHSDLSMVFFQPAGLALGHLPTEASMGRSTPTLPSLGEEQFCIPAGLVKDHPSTSSIIVAEGILPLSSKILEKIIMQVGVCGPDNSLLK